ncbi:MAG: hypothetical protein ACOZQL_22770 [Myxococcota bacterium]
MTPVERAALESQVERHLRRGELSDAWRALQQLVAAFPDDDALAARLAQLEESLDPLERRRAAVAKAEPSGTHKTPMHQAEALAAAGRYAEAIGIYRQLLAERPDWELVKERLAELFQLARVAHPARAPVNREAVLEHLLERISTRKRS